MTSDYPDWTRLFYLTGTTITIPISIQAANVTIPISIQSSAVWLPVVISASMVTVNIRISSSAVTLNVNIESQTAYIDFNFADQSVAVFDAAKWFAHNAAQWGVTGGGSIGSGSYTTISRVVPAGKVGFLCGLGCGYLVAGADVNIFVVGNIAGSDVTGVGFNTGGALIFDTPFRATAGQTIAIYVYNFSAATKVTIGSIWGYDETA